MTKLDLATTGFVALPARADFSARYRKGEPQVVWARLVSDLETPVSAMLKLSQDRPFSCLLELVEGGAVRGRYSIIGISPDVVWRAFGDRAEINRQSQTDPDAFTVEKMPALESLRALLAQSRIELPSELPPIAAGVLGYMGYDTVRLVEHLPNPRPDALGVPDSIFVRPTIMVVFDSVKAEMIVVTPVYPDAGLSPADAYAAAVERLRVVVAALDEPLPHATAMSGAQLALPAIVSNTKPSEYLGMVKRAKEYIAAGDIFQVVLAQRFSSPFSLPPLALYRALRRTNPSPFLFYLDFGTFSLVGSSPEILVRVRDGEVTIRPLAGTRRRGTTPEEDKALEKELLADPKERAEHLMLLDLGRNDVGRVAKIGTVRVTESFAIERYSHVMHIVQPRRRRARQAPRRDRRADGRLPRRHALGCAQGAGDGDHRRAGEGQARALRRLRRLLFRRRRDGQLHRAAHGADQGRHDPRAGGCRHRRRQRRQGRAGGMRLQGPRPLQGRRGGRPLRREGQARQSVTNF